MFIREPKGFNMVWGESGAFFVERKTDEVAFGIEGSMISEFKYSTIRLDASRTVPVGDDNRPYNMRLLPILIY